MKKYYSFRLAILFLVSLFLSACKDDLDTPGSGPTYTITGHLYLDCSMQPVANLPIDLFQEYLTGLTGHLNGGVLAETTTDANGYFKFEFKDMDGATEKIRMTAGAGYDDLMVNIPENKSHYNLVIFQNPTATVQVKLNVLNPHQLGDTLLIQDFKSVYGLKFLCPLNSGHLFTSSNIVIHAMSFSGNIETLDWYFHPYDGNAYQKVFTINSFCLTDTIKLTIDIN